MFKLIVVLTTFRMLIEVANILKPKANSSNELRTIVMILIANVVLIVLH